MCLEEDTELNIPDDPILMPGEKDIEVNAEHDEDIGGKGICQTFFF